MKFNHSFRFHILLPLVLCLSGLNAQTPYTLKMTLQAARQGNPSLAARRYNVGMANADLITAGLRPNPVLNNQSLQLSRQSAFPVNTTWSDSRNRQVWWQFTRPFQLPGQRSSRIQVAKAALNVEENALSEFERNTLKDVASQWMDVWMARKQLDILVQAKSTVDTLVMINRQRLKNQVITETDLNRTELLASQYEIRIRAARQNYSNELELLHFLTGVKEEISIDTTEDVSFVLMNQNPDSLIAMARENRSDVLMAKADNERAILDIRFQKKQALPQPELGFIYNPQNSIPYWGFFGTIEIPLFSRNQGEIKRSEIRQQQSNLNLISTRILLTTEIRNAYKLFVVSRSNLESSRNLAGKAESILYSVRYSYLRGGTTIIDYLEAQRSWLDTRQDYYEMLAQYRRSYIDLLYAAGLMNQLIN